ncbi:MAG TPA: FecR domain-containing protein [Gemmatimonadaceae bacterium]|nr:FecR domain-containing protein [Gemmatimonadaceae bacterium]
MNMSNSGADPSSISPDDWERIARYITGEATASEADATRRWIAADPHRAGAVQSLESALANVAHRPTPDIDVESALHSVKARFDAPKVIAFAPSVRQAESRSYAALLRIAAAAVVLAGATLVWQNVRRDRADGGTRTYATAIGERRQIALDDGSTVLLGPTTRLVVLDPRGGERGVTLDGIAHFSVVHNSSSPFTVRAGTVTIQDVGTAFSVETDDSAGTRVAVDSGSVAIGPAGAEVSHGAILNARDRAVVGTDNVVTVERAVVSDDDLAWMQGRLVFRDAPLVLVGAELYRWYGVRLRVDDPFLANLHLTASFSGEPVERVLNVISLSLGATVERQGNVAILHRNAASGAAR